MKRDGERMIEGAENGVFVPVVGGQAHMSAEFEIGILNSRHFCFDVSRLVIRSVGVYQRPGTRK